MSDLDSNAKLQAFGEHFETFAKIANYLLVAHSAGFVGCLSVLKDYQNIPQLKGIGLLIKLFGVGLLFAVLFYGSAMAIKINVKAAIMAQKRAKRGQGTVLEVAAYLGLWGSLLTFVVAIIVCVRRFGSL
jgi:hypothetical protein